MGSCLYGRPSFVPVARVLLRAGGQAITFTQLWSSRPSERRDVADEGDTAPCVRIRESLIPGLSPAVHPHPMSRGAADEAPLWRSGVLKQDVAFVSPPAFRLAEGFGDRLRQGVVLPAAHAKTPGTQATRDAARAFAGRR